MPKLKLKRPEVPAPRLRIAIDLTNLDKSGSVHYTALNAQTETYKPNSHSGVAEDCRKGSSLGEDAAVVERLCSLAWRTFSEWLRGIQFSKPQGNVIGTQGCVYSYARTGRNPWHGTVAQMRQRVVRSREPHRRKNSQREPARSVLAQSVPFSLQNKVSF